MQMHEVYLLPQYHLLNAKFKAAFAWENSCVSSGAPDGMMGRGTRASRTVGQKFIQLQANQNPVQTWMRECLYTIDKFGSFLGLFCWFIFTFMLLELLHRVTCVCVYFAPDHL